MHHTMLLEDVKSPKITLLIPKGRYLFFAFLEIILKNQKEKETRQYRIEHQLAMELEERRKEKD
jgi:hypothetical protein